MKIMIKLPKEYEDNFILDKFDDFFNRVKTDIDNEGLCGNYEKETAEMFNTAFKNATTIEEDPTNNNIAEFTGQIINIFEDFLEERNISLMNIERESEDDAIIYGTDYGELQTSIEDTLNNWDITEIIENRKYPNIENPQEYHDAMLKYKIEKLRKKLNDDLKEK